MEGFRFASLHLYLLLQVRLARSPFLDRWIYRFGADPKGQGREERLAAFNRAPFVSATGSALRSVPTVALSSAQFNFILTSRNASSEETARKKSPGGP